MTASAPFRFAERLPAAALAPWIVAYWEFAVRDGAPPLHVVPPDGCTSIMLASAGPTRGLVLVTGPWLEPLSVPVAPGTRFLGIRLRPGAVPAAFGIDPNLLRNQNIPADHLMGAVASALRVATADDPDIDVAVTRLDALFQDVLKAAKPIDALVDAAVRLLEHSRGERAIGDLARALNTSPRTLLRRFRAATGLTPKQFARVRRLLAAAWHVVDGHDSWSQIAASAGYADQPHLHHDFVDLTGLKPEAFGERVRSTEHDQVRRSLP